ncbi:DUF3889 domain-containing protein [Paenibacillus sp. CF384]|uniref:DUF3889 domain-containing protein n=1 Tax=Paenibacillus sp. CF384 TaxID=1884382 RepID=UPI0008947E3B|nr:DUF3889 domain-containing protein [Paenibacillus sp. CF384]SDW25387.1 Protein of unknown function [Paenibacillus sp. CF384]
MRPLIILMMTCMMLFCAVTPVSAEPPYAKWGRLAMKETTHRYHAEIVDYKHVGRKVEEAGLMSETFRLLLNKGSRKFEVTVRIWFEQHSEKVVRIQFMEDGKVDGLPAFSSMI